MTKHQQFFKTKIHFVLIVLLFLGNFFNFTLSLSYFSEESLDLEQNSQDEFNFYKGVNCTKLGEYDSNYGTPYEMLIAEHSSRTLAFIRENYGILVVDISDPEQPFFVNQYFERERIEALFVSNDYLFIVNSSDDLLIYNIQDLSNPLLTFAGFLDSTYYFTSLFVQDDILYAGVGYSGLVMYNISIPWDPQFVSEYQHESYLDRFDDIVVCDNNLYLCHENVFQIVDLTDIQNPNLTGIFLADRTYTDFRDIFILDDKAYLCADDGCFFILDIADLTNPTQITAIWDESQYFSDFYTDGSTGYLLSYYGGLALLDLTNLPYIEYLNKENSKGEYCSLGFHVGHPILLDSQEGIEIYEVNEDYSTELLSRFWDGGYAVNVVVNENHAFVANSYNGLEIYKIRNTLAPEFRSRTLVGSRCSNVYVNKNLAYVIDHDYDELYTIDISNKRNPKILSYQNLQIEINNSTYYPSNFEIIGDQALVNYYGSTRTLVILDLSNSSDFQVIDLIPINAYVNDLHYDFPYIYLQVNHEYFSIYFNDGSEWILLSNTYIVHQLRNFFVYENSVFFAGYSDLIIYNISNPQAPTLSSVFHGFDNSYEGYDRVFVQSDYAYLISEFNQELQILNVEDMKHPIIEGGFTCNESLVDLFVKDDVLYLTSATVNLEIFQLDRFISILNYIIYTPIAGMIAIIGVPIIIVASVRAKRRREAIKNMSTTQMPPREEIQAPTGESENDTIVSVSPEDYGDPKVLALAKKLIDAVEKDSK